MKIKVKLVATDQKIPISFIDNSIFLKAGFGDYIYDTYSGETVITPKAYTDQELLTANKNLTNNILIKEIPISETSNPAGGLTLYIGG